MMTTVTNCYCFIDGLWVVILAHWLQTSKVLFAEKSALKHKNNQTPPHTQIGVVSWILVTLTVVNTKKHSYKIIICTDNDGYFVGMSISSRLCFYGKFGFSDAALKRFLEYLCFNSFYHSIFTTGCSLVIEFFSQEFSKVCHLALASTWLLLVVQKITIQ